MQEPAQSRRAVKFGVFQADLVARELRKNGAKIRLQDQPFQVLALLLENAGEVVTREKLRQKLWPADTFVDFDNGLNTAINKIREALCDSAEKPRYVETLPRRGYRFIAPVAGVDKIAPAAAEVPGVASPAKRRLILGPGMISGLAAFLSVIAAIAWTSFSRFRGPRLPNEIGTIVAADFDNRTGDPVFDGTLRQALSAQLEQSPYFIVLSEARIRETLELMGRAPGEGVKEQFAREVCQRAGGSAVVSGSIASLGSQYVIALAAAGCRAGDSLSQEQAQANRKEDVLKALGGMSGRLRRKMGESLSSIQSFDTPIEQATTPSLEALKAYSAGWRTQPEKGDQAAIPFFQHAIELDPNFAMAYAGLADCYAMLEEPTIANQNFAKAFALRDRVTEREKFVISTQYYQVASGDLTQTIQNYQLWKKTYPHDILPPANLANVYIWVGEYEKSIAETMDAFRMKPDFGIGTLYMNLIQAEAALGRFDEAKAEYQKAMNEKALYPLLNGIYYFVAFAQSDFAAMDRLVTLSVGNAEDEDFQLSAQADTEAYFGRLQKARNLSNSAIDSARRNKLLEGAALWEVNSALREAEFGNVTRARQLAAAAIAMAPGRDVQLLAALAHARAGDIARASVAAEKLAREFPENTILKFYWLPSIRAAIEIRQAKPAAALKLLQSAAAYELAIPPPFQLGTLYPVYLRGQAYLDSRQAGAAAVEFQKILDHRGIVMNFPLGALARLGLARAYALEGNIAKSRTAYGDFFALWKDADRDTPILYTARSEYAKLK
jgi:eukaryotic-like serine/threonine-protein kinase